MSKRKKPKKAVKTASEQAPSSLSHNPFAALAKVEGPPQAMGEAPVASNDVPPVVQRFPNKLVVRADKKGRRGKTVTIISGIPAGALAKVTTEMKKALGCGASTEGPDLILQGALVARAAAWLTKQGAQKLSTPQL